MRFLVRIINGKKIVYPNCEDAVAYANVIKRKTISKELLWGLRLIGCHFLLADENNHKVRLDQLY